jgi:hypothetical protein
MLKINLLLFALFLLAVVQLQAQQLQEFSPKSSGYKAKNVSKGDKRMYVNTFSIYFEIYKEAVDTKSAGGFGRTIKNAAKAKAAVGLLTLEKDEIQAKADQLYNEFLAKVKAEGFEMISAEEASATDFLKGSKPVTGPAIFETDMPGIVQVVPSGYTGFYKERNALSNKLAGLQKSSESLSKELNDALIADISLVYAFSETGNDWNIGNQAKVKLLVNYRLANIYNYTNENTKSGSISSMMNKANQAVTLSSYIHFTRGKNKIGGSPEAQYIGNLKSDLEIAGVLQKEKILAYSTQTQATATLLNPIVVIRGDNYSEKTKWLEPDGKKYAEGLYLAGNAFIGHHTAEIFKQ